jgi:hypothetical protein
MSQDFQRSPTVGDDHVGHLIQKYLGHSRSSIAAIPTIVDPKIASDFPSKLLKGRLERRDARGCGRIVRGAIHEHADVPRVVDLGSACRQR